MNTTHAIAYLRTSSAANVGADKDSARRQCEACEAFAKVRGIDLVAAFYDPAVSGADAIESRPGFAALLDRIEANGVRTVIVEDASRFARQLMTQEAGIALLTARGVTLLTAGGENLTDSDDEMRVMIRQVVGAVMQCEKARLVKKLRHAREATGHLGGRKAVPAKTVGLARRLKARGMSLREIAAEMAKAGHLAPSGKAYLPGSVAKMIAA